MYRPESQAAYRTEVNLALTPVLGSRADRRIEYHAPDVIRVAVTLPSETPRSKPRMVLGFSLPIALAAGVLGRLTPSHHGGRCAGQGLEPSKALPA